MATLAIACRKTSDSEGFDVLNFSDDTSSAAELVAQANEDLNKIKIMYKKNESQLEDLKIAMSKQDIESVKKITDDLNYIINDGMSLGEQALEKIERAEAMNINADFKQYLELKAESLQKQLDAFENRRQAARLLRDSFGTANPTTIEKAKGEFKTREESFSKLMEESHKLSKQANDLAKESSRNSRQ